jgi:hypothetical protein
MNETDSPNPIPNPGLDDQPIESSVPEYPTVSDGKGDLDDLSPQSVPEVPVIPSNGEGDGDKPTRPGNEVTSHTPTVEESKISTTTTSVVEQAAHPSVTVSNEQIIAQPVQSPQEAVPILGQESAAQPIAEIAVPEKPVEPANADPLVTGGILGLGSLAAGFAAWRIKRKNAKK